MRSFVEWAVKNYPAMNVIVLAVLLVGILSGFLMRREVFPNFELEIILVSVPYPGASPTEAEEGICQKVEEAVRSIAGVKKVTSVAQEGTGHVVIELENGVDAQKALNEIRSEVDRIPSFPELAEDPEVKQITFRTPAIRIAITGPPATDSSAEVRLREVAERVRDELLLLPNVSQANLLGTRDFQIDIEIPEATLRKHNLSLQEVARIVRRQNLELPSGTIKTSGAEVLLRGKDKRLVGEEIAQVPLVTDEAGVVLTVGDLGRVRDEFADIASVSLINGRPGVVISIDRTATEDLVAMAHEVNRYVEEAKLPEGYGIMSYRDTSIDVVDRLDLLVRNGLQGLVIVFICLALFLEIRVAFWVSAGIPFSLFGACAILFWQGETMNMLSMFGFLMVVGMVVDDAIVVGENIYSRRQKGEEPVAAAINGTIEVLPSIVASVLTTVVCFMPLMFVSGVMGKFIAVMPLAIISALLISLIEASVILPVHMAEEEVEDTGPWGWIRHRFDAALTWFVDTLYTPVLRFSLAHAPIVLSGSFVFLIVAVGIVRGGLTPWSLFPKMDVNSIEARIQFPDGTPAAITLSAAQRVEEAILKVDRELAGGAGRSVIKLRHVLVGSQTAPGALGPESRLSGAHIGGVTVELVDAAERNVTSDQLLALWRQAVGEIAGAESVVFTTPEMGPGGKPIEFKLMAPAEKMAELEQAVEEAKAKLATYVGVYDVRDDSNPGKYEFQIKVKDSAKALGVPLAEIAETVRASYYGEEIMRLQRGRHEVKLMARYPVSERKSLATLGDVRIRTSDGAERPLFELADVRVERGYSEINRLDQFRSITITADIDETVGNAYNVTQAMMGFLPGIFERHPGVFVRWEGQQQESSESIKSLLVGLLVAVLIMFILLAMEFRSYYQPLLILTIIPFSVAGAVYGHALLGMPISLFSVFGLVALCGIVVNDSIVLIDFINARREEGSTIYDALVETGRRRFRPIMLTSLTTIGGLGPILLETSVQAQVVIPMALSICAGLVTSTVLCLILVPVFYGMAAWLMGVRDEALVAEAARPGVPLAPAVETAAKAPFADAVPGATNGHPHDAADPDELLTRN